MRTVIRANGFGNTYWSHVFLNIQTLPAWAATGTTRAPPQPAAVMAPPFATRIGPRGPSTANAASHPPRMHRIMLFSPIAPLRLDDPRQTPYPSLPRIFACNVPSAESEDSTTIGTDCRYASKAACRPCQKQKTIRLFVGRGASYTTRTRHVNRSRRRRPVANSARIFSLIFFKWGPTGMISAKSQHFSMPSLQPACSASSSNPRRNMPLAFRGSPC